MSIPALKDNYIWLIIHAPSRHCLIVDPGDAFPVLVALKKEQLNPIGILLTHHHRDHVGGVENLLKNYSIPVFGPAQEKIACVTNPLWRHHERILFETMQIDFQILSISGHTHGHIAYYGHGAVFCGDTLFTGGCGRIFEGTIPEMYAALNVLAALPDLTKIYCGHEYTIENLKFALMVEPKNMALQQRMQETINLRAANHSTVPSTLVLEKATNPFLRCHTTAVKEAAQTYCGRHLLTPMAVFGILREWKNIL